MSCGVGHRHGSDLALPWLWHRPVAAALIEALAWEPPYAMGSSPRKGKKTEKKKKNEDPNLWATQKRILRALDH